jgi:hypothetical protein
MVRMLIRFRERFEFRWSRTDPRRRRGLAGAAAGLLLLAVAVALPAGGAAARQSPAGWLRDVANRDGGFPAEPGAESSRQMTGWAMLGLEAAGINPLDSARPSPVRYLRRNAGELRSATDLSLAILALDGAGIDTRHFAGHDLVAGLVAKRRRNGSYLGWPNATAFAVMALRSAGAGGIAPSLAWLRRVQGKDGGWGSVVGAAADPDSTGAVLQALAGSRGTRRAVRFLRQSQQGSGGWGLAATGPVNSQSTAWAVQGMIAAGVDPDATRRHGRSGLDYLAARRAGDGHYRYSSSSDQTPVWVTAQALAAVNREPFPLAPVPRSKVPSQSAKAGRREVHANRRTRGGGARGGLNAVAPRQDGQRSPLTPSPARRVRGAPGPAHNDRAAEQRPSTNAAFRDDDGGDFPMLAILIALGSAGLIVTGVWLVGRRLSW